LAVIPNMDKPVAAVIEKARERLNEMEVLAQQKLRDAEDADLARNYVKAVEDLTVVLRDFPFTKAKATAESRLYADLGGKPCFAEEIGALGRMLCSESVEADVARVNLFSLWAHDCRGFLWWCAFDQDHLAHAPYDWCTAERDWKIRALFLPASGWRSSRRLFPRERA
jgi:hypothetical protein